MWSLTGRPVFILAVVLAAAAPLLAVWLWGRGRPPGRRGIRLARVAARTGLLLASQLLAMSALFLWVNNQYGFYTSWADLAGGAPPPTQIQTNGLVRAGGGTGTVEILTVPGRVSGARADTLVWLPPQYHDPANAGHRFPVVMFLPGQPSTPQAVFKNYDFAATASREIAAGQVPPFVAVFPPLMTHPPRDTECTNVPQGPQAESWLAADVPAAVTARYRTEPPGPGWSVMGWSTGGFCATKLLLQHPGVFGAAVSFGGYYTPLIDATTGDLFGGSTQVRNHNSPQWLYTANRGLHGGRLLMVTGQQDRFAWRSTQQMLTVTRGDGHVALLDFPTGGHNYRNYRSYLGQTLRWIAGGPTG